ncbi:hypothetical protein M9H77_06763 [Catharanthus roseus]|uniref:Uncharacterized protein n=1 Tax=Catharanthus roseus TaxID=4058 RepID=A0ACC0BT91_CATRO|nr:hypothetical protein M9H77_06763 [Catharanthus roseus]
MEMGKPERGEERRSRRWKQRSSPESRTIDMDENLLETLEKLLERIKINSQINKGEYSWEFYIDSGKLLQLINPNEFSIFILKKEQRVIFEEKTEETLENLKQKMANFAKERDWDRFHSPRNLL